MRIDDPPDNHHQHRRAPHQTCPIHEARVQIAARDGGQTQDRDHQAGEACRERADYRGELAEVPGPRAEVASGKEGTDRDWDCEGDEGGDGGDAEDGADGDGAAEDEEGEADPDDGVEPDGVDGRVGDGIDLLPDAGQGEAVVAGVGEGDSARGDHAALAHAEAADDGQAEDGKSDLLGHHLQEVGGPGLAEVGVDDGGDVDDGVGRHELEEPAEETAKAGGHDDGARGGDVGVCAFF